MRLNAQNGTVPVNGTPMEYVVFGRGKMPLVILPGLGDGLKTVRGQARALAVYYRRLAQKFKVYIFSRKAALETGYTTKAMADDQMLALDTLGIDKFYLMGVSQGGMIAQHIAIRYPEAVEKLIIAVSAPGLNEAARGVLKSWIEYAERGDYKALMTDTFEKIYSPKALKRYRPLYPLVTRMGKPKDFERFCIQANACLTHNTHGALAGIQCPTLIIGGADDRVVGIGASREMADTIGQSRLVVYEGLGHAAYEESKDFIPRVSGFLLEGFP